MARPKRKYNPHGLVILSGLTLLALAAYLGASYARYAWIPSSKDALAALLGVLLTTACHVMPDVLGYRRDRDGYCRRLLANEIPRGRRLGAGIWGALTGVVIVLLGPQLDRSVACYLGGSLVSVTAAYPHYRAIWRRMWILHNEAAHASVGPVGDESSEPGVQ